MRVSPFISRGCAIGVVIGLCIAAHVAAYCTLDTRWPGNTVTMSHNFPPTGELMNGTMSWAENALSAMEEWSDVTSQIRFVDGGDNNAGQSRNDGLNNMIFSDSAAGDAFGDDVLAITLSRQTLDGNILESDIVFNDNVTWNAYDGTLRIAAGGEIVFDFRRVALHELGHVLGLNHPDDACGQDVAAIMNAQTTDVDRLTNDDRNGLSFVYAQGNQPPIAMAGPDLFGDALTPFVLNASLSSDPDGTVVRYEWKLDGDLVAVGRVAEISLRTGEYALELTVFDDDGAASTDSLTITVDDAFRPPQDGNLAPVADAGTDQFVTVGDLITLNGSASFDPDGEIDRYVWTSGTAILGTEPSIRVALQLGAHEIVLTVFDDRGDDHSDSVIITVEEDSVNPLPDGVGEPGDPVDQPFMPDVSPTAPAPCGAIGIIPLLTAIVGLRFTRPRRALVACRKP